MPKPQNPKSFVNHGFSDAKTGYTPLWWMFGRLVKAPRAYLDSWHLRETIESKIAGLRRNPGLFFNTSTRALYATHETAWVNDRENFAARVTIHHKYYLSEKQSRTDRLQITYRFGHVFVAEFADGIDRAANGASIGSIWMGLPKNELAVSAKDIDACVQSWLEKAAAKEVLKIWQHPDWMPRAMAA